MEILKNVLYKQYYEIETYIHERSNFIKDQIENYIQIINDSSNIYPIISNNLYEKSMIYYDMISDTIQNKYDIIGLIQFRQLEVELADYIYIFGKSITEINDYLEKVDKYLRKKEEKVRSFFTNIYESIKNKFKKDKHENNENTDNIDNNQDVEESQNPVSKFREILKVIQSIIDKDFVKFQKTIVDIPLPFFPLLHLTITPFMSLGTHLKTKMLIEDKIGLSLDMHIRGEVGINLEVGIYIPKGKAHLQISVSCGINGILVSGKAGIKISFYLIEEKYETDLYFSLNAFSFTFYVKFKISINVWQLKYSYEFYLINFVYKGLNDERHKIKLHDLKLFNLKKILLLQNYIKNIIEKENLFKLN